MNLKDKIKNKGFWISLASAVIVFLQLLGVKINAPYVNEIINAACSVLIILGIISNPTSGTGYIDAKKDSINDLGELSQTESEITFNEEKESETNDTADKE